MIPTVEVIDIISILMLHLRLGSSLLPIAPSAPSGKVILSNIDKGEELSYLGIRFGQIWLIINEDIAELTPIEINLIGFISQKNSNILICVDLANEDIAELIPNLIGFQGVMGSGATLPSWRTNHFAQNQLFFVLYLTLLLCFV